MKLRRALDPGHDYARRPTARTLHGSVSLSGWITPRFDSARLRAMESHLVTIASAWHEPRRLWYELLAATNAQFAGGLVVKPRSADLVHEQPMHARSHRVAHLVRKRIAVLGRASRSLG